MFTRALCFYAFNWGNTQTAGNCELAESAVLLKNWLLTCVFRHQFRIVAGHLFN